MKLTVWACECRQWSEDGATRGEENDNCAICNTHIRQIEAVPASAAESRIEELERQNTRLLGDSRDLAALREMAEDALRLIQRERYVSAVTVLQSALGSSEAATGGEPCKVCEGTGASVGPQDVWPDYEDCEACLGTGQQPSTTRKEYEEVEQPESFKRLAHRPQCRRCGGNATLCNCVLGGGSEPFPGQPSTPRTVHLPQLINDQLGVSRSEARRAITQGGVKINEMEVVNVDASVADGDVVSYGKRQKFIVGQPSTERSES